MGGEGLLFIPDLIAEVFRVGKPVIQVGELGILMNIVKEEI